MTVAQKLSACDYSIAHEHSEQAALETFKLVDHTVACATSCSLKGSTISGMWKRLLDAAPKACPEHKQGFEEAKRVLYKDYDKKLYTELYQEYCKKEYALKQKELQIERELTENVGDQWKDKFEKNLKASDEYLQFQHADREVKHHLDAFNLYIDGPLHHLKKGTYIAM